ncbi:MAG: ECF-type sigma factor [Thermoanaerobaculia bacterium]
MDAPDAEITALLEAMAAGDEAPLSELFSATYARLYSLARDQRRRWRGQETLSTTALVHEAYLKLSQQESPRWQSRGHFFRVAARAMRHILINYAERSRTAKRGGGREHIPAEDAALVHETRVEELLALDEALTRLEQLSPRQAQVVECRFFAGLDVEETAEALAVSEATVMRDWRRGKTWLYRELAPLRAPGRGGAARNSRP